MSFSGPIPQRLGPSEGYTFRSKRFSCSETSHIWDKRGIGGGDSGVSRYSFWEVGTEG